MKAEHRHELKTNELADWLGHLPQWAKKNQTWLVGSAVVIIAIVGVYSWKSYVRDPGKVQSQIELTRLMNNITQQKGLILQGQSTGLDNSAILNSSAESLLNFAGQETGPMAALAYIKGADALRAEMLYRASNVSTADLQKQIDQARAAYTSGIEAATDVPSLKASAQYGLGLCDEHLGDLAKAGETYKAVAENPDYEGTVAAAAAAYRIRIIGDFATKITFRPRPMLPPEMIINRPDPNDMTDIPGMPPIETLLQDVNAAQPEPAAPNLPDVNAVSTAIKEAATEATENVVEAVDVNAVKQAIVEAVGTVAEKVVAPNLPVPTPAADPNEPTR